MMYLQVRKAQNGKIKVFINRQTSNYQRTADLFKCENA